jgi:hypothetical protein
MFSRGLTLDTTLKIWDMIGYHRELALYKISLSIFELIGKKITPLNYDETIINIHSYWADIDEDRLLELATNTKLTNEKLSKLLKKTEKETHCNGKEGTKY